MEDGWMEEWKDEQSVLRMEQLFMIQ
jgi:hypothetical protein